MTFKDAGYPIAEGVVSSAECIDIVDRIETQAKRSRAGARHLPWHQDTALPMEVSFDAPGWGPWSKKAGILYAHAPASALSRVVALRVHLDASTAANGPLRVIPGSHNAGVLTDGAVLDYAKTHRHVDYLAGPGGVVAMRPLLIHSSSKG
jgi:ectoine hydroxylase-related dioxygenase (phytanoyl-CoA dioxygenase family)